MGRGVSALLGEEESPRGQDRAGPWQLMASRQEGRRGLQSRGHCDCVCVDEEGEIERMGEAGGGRPIGRRGPAWGRRRRGEVVFGSGLMDGKVAHWDYNARVVIGGRAARDKSRGGELWDSIASTLTEGDLHHDPIEDCGLVCS